MDCSIKKYENQQNHSRFSMIEIKLKIVVRFALKELKEFRIVLIELFRIFSGK